jgi:hypothetical protein
MYESTTWLLWAKLRNEARSQIRVIMVSGAEEENGRTVKHHRAAIGFDGSV